MSGRAALVPRHVAIIIDGNGRWAARRGLSAVEGHRAGAENLRARVRDAMDLGIEELAVYAFSTENWTRSSMEVQGLIALCGEYVDGVTPELHEAGVRIRFLGRRDKPVPSRLIAKMVWAEELTKANKGFTFFIPFNYGGRAEIVDAARHFTGSTEDEFRAHLYAPDMHDPELVIRTGGEQRLSNYLLWQLAEAELVFREELWPDFTRRCFEETLAEFGGRRVRTHTDG
jgi:undecaprenyl diphosphate synthase